MTAGVTRLAAAGYENVYRLDLGSAVAFTAVHACFGGTAFGGIRVWPYPSDDAALTDALLLARAMTRKVVLAGLPAGGAKTVIRHPDGPWPVAERAEALARLGEFIESLGGRYHCGYDMGFTDTDDAAVKSTTRHVACSGIDPWTARSVLLAMNAVCEPRSVAVQGLGAVGRELARLLAADGVRVVGADLLPSLAPGLGVDAVDPEAIYDAECGVFSPNAKGGLLDAATIPRLRCDVVCGAANNPLATLGDADRLHARGILLVPDVIASAGAVIKGASDALGEPGEAETRLAAVADRVREVVARARAEDRSPYHVALEFADELIRARL